MADGCQRLVAVIQTSDGPKVDWDAFILLWERELGCYFLRHCLEIDREKFHEA
jgi:hypothetical protein